MRIISCISESKKINIIFSVIQLVIIYFGRLKPQKFDISESDKKLELGDYAKRL